jgi:ribonuclease P protein component
VAFAVGRRTGSAVERNRIRRRLRAAIDGCPDLAPGAAYLFDADRSVLTVPFDELRETVATLVRRTGATP